MSEVFSILLHNRQRYEQGKEGLWFSLPTTTEKLQAALREIGISADNPQDFFLYDYRSTQERPIGRAVGAVVVDEVLHPRRQLDGLVERLLVLLGVVVEVDAHIPGRGLCSLL